MTPIKKRLQKFEAFLLLCALVFLVSCAVTLTSPYTPEQIAAVILSIRTDLPDLYVLSANDEGFSDYILTAYQIEPSDIADGAVYYAKGAQATEIAVFSFFDGIDMEKTEAALWHYIRYRAQMFAGYAPKQAALLENSMVSVRGNYAALLICEQPQTAQAAFFSCFTDNAEKLPKIPSSLPLALADNPKPPPTSVGGQEKPAVPSKTDGVAAPVSDEYDKDAILLAWNSGDKSALTGKNSVVYDICIEVIDALTDDGMTDYDKELAIHDWIILNTRYDEGALSRFSDAQPDPDSENPYGLLVNKKAVCRGYTSTFQLFMDMLKIECVTVEGTSTDTYGYTVEHAWNIVRLDGEWYCVDVTWNDPIGPPDSYIGYRYFNVSSDYLRESYNHQWDESLVPNAAAPNADYRGNPKS